MRRTIFGFTITIMGLILVTGLFVTWSAASEQKAVNLRYTFAGPPKGPFADANKWFAEEIGRRTGGKVKITIHWGGTLLSMPDTVPGIGKQVAHCGAGIGRATLTKNPHWSTLGLLGAGTDLWTLIWATYEMNQNSPEIKADLEQLNVVPTHGYTPGTPLYVLKKPAASLSDLKGRRVRAGAPDEAKIMPELGMEPAPVDIFELYEAIDRGVVDGAAITVMWADTLKLYEVAKYFLMFTRTLIAGDVTTLFNKDVWNGFTPQTRKVINEVTREYNNKYAQKVIELEATARKKMETKYGVQFIKAPPEVDAAYGSALVASREAWFKKWDGKGYKTRKVWEQFQGYVAKYEKELAEKGYPWDR